MEKTSAIERLEKLLDDKDHELEKLQRQLNQHENDEEEMVWNWTRHLIIDKEDEDEDLPVPRLELKWVNQDDDGYNRLCWYSLVFRHLLGDIIKIPMGVTKISGDRANMFVEGTDHHSGSPCLDIPYRDGVHIAHEARQLKLPAFVTWKHYTQEVLPGEERENFTLGPVIKWEKPDTNEAP